MNRETRGFLVGLATGRQLKGWGGSRAAQAFAPTCRNDAGVYDRFYIDYPVALQTFSYGRFCNQTAIFGSAGEIIPVDAVQLDSRTVCVFADISNQTCLRVFGNGGTGLTLADGREAPAYAAELWVDGVKPYGLGYMAEGVRIKTCGLDVGEIFAVLDTQSSLQVMREQAALQPADTGAEEGFTLAYS